MAHSSYVLIICLVAATVNSQIPNRPQARPGGVSAGISRGTQGTAVFRNGGRFNVNALLSALDIRPVVPSRSRATTVRFSGADRGVENNQEEQNFRNFFSRSEGNEFVNTDNVSNSAMSSVEQLGVLVDKTGIDTATSFDADGNAIDSGVVDVSSQRTDECPFDKPNTLPCESSFREPTGRCTNLMQGRKTWGMAGTPYSRVLSALYEDGIGERRKTAFTSNNVMRSPRDVSTLVTTTNVVLNFDGFNSFIMQWGQYVAHEFTHLAESEADRACCPDQIFEADHGTSVTPTSAQLGQIREEIERLRGDICMQVELENDPVYGNYICMSQTRSRPAPLHDCSLGPRQQMNTVTHTLDGSAVYGSSLAEQTALRAHTGGKLKTQTVNGATLPPADTRPEKCSAEKKAINRCPFLGGDSRINVTPNLISIHTTAVVKHNQIATRLAGINPHWNDERLFQESRRILSSIEAKVHYYEYLPIIIGANMVRKYKMNSYPGFDPDVNPSAVSEMAHAAMRFGHSTINGFFTVFKEDGTEDFVNLRPLFSNSEFVYDGGYRQCVRGLLNDVPWIVDRNFPEQMRDFLFNERLDIISLNINRGRDHGFNSYVEYRKHYGLSFPRSFNDMLTTHEADTVDGLKKAYAKVEDIELYIAGVTEKHVEGGLIGELFANILGDGFSRLMKGDRFFFESPHSGLTPAQVEAIRGFTFSQLLCEGAGLTNVSDKGYMRPGFLGAKEVPCSSFNPLNLNLWKEKPDIPATCEWKIISRSPCCFSEQQVTRECEGPKSCRCSGKAKIIQSCTCRGYRCFLDLHKKCEWKWGFRG